MPLGSSVKPITSPYRGYVATYESVDGEFLIVVQGTKDVVTGKASVAADVQKEFEKLVDDYLATQKELGH